MAHCPRPQRHHQPPPPTAPTTTSAIPDTGYRPTESARRYPFRFSNPQRPPPDLGAATKTSASSAPWWASRTGPAKTAWALQHGGGPVQQLNTLGLSTARLSSAASNLGWAASVPWAQGWDWSAPAKRQPHQHRQQRRGLLQQHCWQCRPEPDPVPVISALSIVGAVPKRQPLAVASSVAACFPPYGTIISLCIQRLWQPAGQPRPHPARWRRLPTTWLNTAPSPSRPSTASAVGPTPPRAPRAAYWASCKAIDGNNANPRNDALAIDPSHCKGQLLPQAPAGSKSPTPTAAPPKETVTPTASASAYCS